MRRVIRAVLGALVGLGLTVCIVHDEYVDWRKRRWYNRGL